MRRHIALRDGRIVHDDGSTIDSGVLDAGRPA
jgi:hypothetical protein